MDEQEIISNYRCNDIPELQVIRGEKHVRISDVRHSVSSGCLLCGVLWAFIQGYEYQENDMISVSRRSSGMTVTPPWSDMKNRYSQPESEIYSTEDVGYGMIPWAGTVSDNTGSDQAFRQAVEWFLTCLNTHHTLCRDMSNDTSFLPTRLLDVGTGTDGKVSLKETTGLNQARYVCLSHSWGGHQPLTTKAATLQERMTEIPWHDIPKTFQDAIKYTRALTLQYIWIDSLCIIQDSKEDWQHESALMADIYRNGIITISASASSGPYDGLFVSPDSNFTATKVKQLPTDGTKPERFFSRPALSHMRKNHPLLNRCWAFQERLLSPRVLHFGVHELLWECMQRQECECSREPFGLVMTRGWFSEKSYFHPFVLSSLPLLHTANTWRELVQDFFRGQLTFSGDAFPALSGAAKVIKQSLEQRGFRPKYIAGLWECWFLEDILWSVSVTSRESRPQTWRAPTFSWASVICARGSILKYKHIQLFKNEARLNANENPHMDALTYLTTLREFHCTPVGSDELGQISAAYIVLVGPLMQATISNGDLEVLAENRAVLWPEFSPDYDLSAPGKWHVGPEDSIWCLHIASQLAPHNGRPILYKWFLVLRRVSSQDEHQAYERIGLLSYREDAAIPEDRWFDPAYIQQDAVVKIV